ncbi:MAG TPA: hypothetical protein PKM32_06960 [Planctomycetota bacterium]|nr:hypothetical protein [Planctomycetota bacterium]
MDIQNFLNRILFRVQCPSQYVGGEWNSIVKDWDKIKGDICFCFPDTYSVGMSNQGLKLLYEIVNDCSDLVCERAFAPLPDMIEFLRQENVSLFSLESNRALCDFHVVGFSIGSNQNWTNVLEMLDLGKIAVWAKDRGEEEPIIIAGGHGVYNVEPGADFLDLVALGDGEELLVEVLRLDATLREQGVSRRERIRKIACDISGVYAPAFYHVSYYDNGTVATIMPEQGMPSLIVSRVLENFEKFK